MRDMRQHDPWIDVSQSLSGPSGHLLFFYDWHRLFSGALGLPAGLTLGLHVQPKDWAPRFYF